MLELAEVPRNALAPACLIFGHTLSHVLSGLPVTHSHMPADEALAGR
jgi:hypothetical protein